MGQLATRTSLPTILIPAQSVDEPRCRAMLDFCSSISFVSSSLVSRLKIDTLGQSEMMISTVNGLVNKQYNYVNIDLYDNNLEPFITILAYVVDEKSLGKVPYMDKPCINSISEQLRKKGDYGEVILGDIFPRKVSNIELLIGLDYLGPMIDTSRKIFFCDQVLGIPSVWGYSVAYSNSGNYSEPNSQLALNFTNNLLTSSHVTVGNTGESLDDNSTGPGIEEGKSMDRCPTRTDVNNSEFHLKNTKIKSNDIPLFSKNISFKSDEMSCLQTGFGKQATGLVTSFDSNYTVTNHRLGLQMPPKLSALEDHKMIDNFAVSSNLINYAFMNNSTVSNATSIKNTSFNSMSGNSLETLSPRRTANNFCTAKIKPGKSCTIFPPQSITNYCSTSEEISEKDSNSEYFKETEEEFFKLLTSWFRMSESIMASSKELSRDNLETKEHFYKTIRFVDKNFETSIAWNHSRLQRLHTNYGNAYARMIRMENTVFKEDVNNKLLFEDALQALLDANIAEIDSSQDTSFGFFLPLICVVKKERETTKLRIVYDCKSKEKLSKLSFNDCVLDPPDNCSNLAAILLRFRLKKWVFVCDVTKFFLMVKRCKFDLQFQRFIYRHSPDRMPIVYKLLTVIFGDRSAPYVSSEVLLNLCNIIGDNYTRAKEAIRDDRYVDDIASGNNNEQELVSLYKEVQQLLEIGGFHLAKSFTNSPKLFEYLQEKRVDELSAKAHAVFDYEDRELDKDLSMFKILGLGLSRDLEFLTPQFCDSVELKLKEINGRWSKRSLSSLISTCFDPLGHFAPTILFGKLLLQRVWKQASDTLVDVKKSWDLSIVDEDILQDIDKFIENIRALRDFRIPRLCINPNADEMKLVCFVDASAKSYGCCFYLIGKVNTTSVSSLQNVGDGNSYPKNIGDIPNSCNNSANAREQLFRTSYYFSKEQFSNTSDRFSGRPRNQITDINGTSVKLIFARSRLCPTKSKVTIARLELMSCTLGAELNKFVSGALNLDPFKTRLYTDSQINYWWVSRNDPGKFNSFVANRLQIIADLTRPDQWAWLHGGSNPADDLTRGVPALKLMKRSTFFEGPDFLRKSEDTWPSSMTIKGQENELDFSSRPEMIKEPSSVFSVCACPDPCIENRFQKCGELLDSHNIQCSS